MNCQANHYVGQDPTHVTRRWFFRDCGVGLGTLALAHLMHEGGYGASATPNAIADPLSPKQPHFAPKAKRVVYLFMAGAPSHLELFDYNPQLAKFNGKAP